MALDMFIDFAVAGPPVGAGTAAVLVQGESTDTTYPNTIPVIQFALGMQNATTIGTATSGTTAGKAQFQALTFTKNVDKASTGLFTACAIGQHFKSAKLYVRVAGAKSAYLTYEFAMVYITQIQTVNGDSAASENIQAAFGAMQVSYLPTLSTGQLASQALISSWSQVTSQPSLAIPGN